MKIALVTPWYGQGIPGGAEAEARRTAENMAQRGLPVEVLTTCVRDFYADWSVNHHRPGRTDVNSVPVYRFPVRPRNTAAFDAINAKLMEGQGVTLAEEAVFMQEMVRSPGLEAHIRDHCDEYLFLLIPYMFGTTYWGIQVCPQRSYLIPCLHDESYARMRILADPFRQARGFICHSRAEMQLAQELYDLPSDRLILMGGGVDTEYKSDGDRFRHKYGIHGPFLLYAGRKDRGKNLPLLVQYFQRFRRAGRSQLELVLIGGGELACGGTPGDGIHNLDYLPMQDKWDAYAAASVLCQPSIRESFSLVMMEAWVARTPVLVHADCAVTADFCRQSNAGLCFASYPEFALALELLIDRPQLALAMGDKGREFVLSNFAWEHIIDRYAQLLGHDTGKA